jgi:hypothetical protein
LFLAVAVFAACTPKPEWPDAGPIIVPPKDSGPPKDCRDVDGDGFKGTGDCSDLTPDQLDCNDNDTTIYPGAPEVCNGVDDNCNFSIDEGLPIVNYYVDNDGDLFGAGTPEPSCKPIAGKVSKGGDCDDTDLNVHPGAPEYCNLKDDDCNGIVDDNVISRPYYVDTDGDGYGVGTGVPDCRQNVPGKAPLAGDCNDADPAIHPGAVEQCNGKDDNCDTHIDESFPGKGAACVTAELGACMPGSMQCVAAFPALTGTCVRNVNPSAEICDGVDNNCNGLTDEPFPLKGTSCTNGLGVCARNYLYICGADGGLRCPGDAGNPTAPSCDGLDNDCNGVIDEFAMGKSYSVADHHMDNGVLTPGFYPSAADIAPIFLTSSAGCNGGNAPGAGKTDAWVSYMAAYVYGIPSVLPSEVYVNQLKEDGSPISSTPVVISGGSSGQYVDVAIGQAGPGMAVVAQYSSQSLDLFYVAPGPISQNLTPINPFYTVTPPSVVSNPKVIRGTGGRAVIFWRESNYPSFGASAIRMQRVSFVCSTPPNCTYTKLTSLPIDLVADANLVDGAFAVASNYPNEVLDTMTCPAAPAPARLAVAYKLALVGSDEKLVIKSFNEDLSGTTTTLPDVYNTSTAGGQLREFDIAWNQGGGTDPNRWAAVFTVAWAGTPDNSALYFWQSAPAGPATAFGGFHSGNGLNSVEMPSIVGRPNGEFFFSTLIYGTTMPSPLEPQVWVGKMGPDGGVALPLAQATNFTGCLGVNCPDGTKRLPFPVSSNAGTLKTNGFIFYGTSLGNMNSTVISCN